MNKNRETRTRRINANARMQSKGSFSHLQRAFRVTKTSRISVFLHVNVKSLFIFGRLVKKMERNTVLTLAAAPNMGID